MAIPNPLTFIGKLCVIVLKRGRKRVVRQKVVSIDKAGVCVEEDDGGKHIYEFSDIAMMNKSQKEVD